MTKEECIRVLDYLSNIWPKAYSPNMKTERKTDLLETIYLALRSFAMSDVMDTCKRIAIEEDNAPTISGIRLACRAKDSQDQRTPKRMNLEGLPEDHPWRGCYAHHDAYVACMEDIKKGLSNGSNFPEYVKRYPKTTWRPWANPELNKGRWPYITADNFGGWETDRNGFCIPYTKRQ